MGKANKQKKELKDAVELTYLIQTLKDVADNKLFTLLQRKDQFRRFGETFVEFFRMISLAKVKHPLISNDNPTVGIVVVTIEGSFLGEFNGKIIRRALIEKEKYQDVRFIAVGEKAVERLKPYSPDIKVFSRMDAVGMYEMAVKVKDYLVDEIMNNRLGKVVVVYCWPKSMDTQRPRALKLLPCDELISKQSQFVSEFERIIEESDPIQIIGYLSHLWVTTRLFEIFIDTNIASAAAQAQFLDDSLDKMRKEEKKAKIKFRKAKKGDIDKSLRETFSARMMVK